ncbi:MAG: hypothetical protein L0Z54_03360 [Thermoplasmata archaeon]|nr:hypothetical protein [Thermoplasmata archaeon]
MERGPDRRHSPRQAGTRASPAERPWMDRARRPGVRGQALELAAIICLDLVLAAMLYSGPIDIGPASVSAGPLLLVLFLLGFSLIVATFVAWALEPAWSDRLVVLGSPELVAAGAHRTMMERRLGVIWTGELTCEVFPRRYASGRAPDRWLVTRPVRVSVARIDGARALVRIRSMARFPGDGIIAYWRVRSRARFVFFALREHFRRRRRYLGNGDVPPGAHAGARRAPTPSEPFTRFSHATGLYEHAVDVFCPRCDYEFTATRSTETRAGGQGDAVCPRCRARFVFGIDARPPVGMPPRVAGTHLGGTDMYLYRMTVECPACGHRSGIEQVSQGIMAREEVAICPECRRTMPVRPPPGIPQATARGGPRHVARARLAGDRKRR